METEPFPDHLVSLQYGWCHHPPWTDEKDGRQSLYGDTHDPVIDVYSVSCLKQHNVEK